MTAQDIADQPAPEYALAHETGIVTIERMVAALCGDGAVDMGMLADSSVNATTSHRGSLSGPNAVGGMFGPASSPQAFDLHSSNVYLAGNLTQARGSGYLAGHLSGASRLSFGAIFIVDLARNDASADWRISALKIQLTWIEGDRSLRPDWTYPVHEKVWQIGDPLPVIVSELDAPWHVYPDNLLRAGVVRDVEDTYARYSWGIDQADFGLLISSYAEDAGGTFSPMGPLTGRHAIVGVQKDFRRAWPWMQHYGEVLGSHVEGDTAAMIVGRAIPQAGRNADEFGAYYPLRLRRDGPLWRIVWFEYRAGWFSRRDTDIDKLLALTLSGEGDRPE
jgi:hypothetical protein